MQTPEDVIVAVDINKANLQGQLNSKAPFASPAFTGGVSVVNGGIICHSGNIIAKNSLNQNTQTDFNQEEIQDFVTIVVCIILYVTPHLATTKITDALNLVRSITTHK